MNPFLHLTFALCCKKSTASPLGSARKAVTSNFAPEGSSFPIHFFLAILASLVFTAPTAQAQLFDSFDSTRPKFRLWNSDAKAQLATSPKTEPGVEAIEVSFTNGSYVHLLYPIEPCALVDEQKIALKASIRIRSAQSGLRIGLRIVFPRSTDHAVRDPLTAVIYGTPIEGGGRWSTSTIEHVGNLVEAQVRFLRAKYGQGIDLQDAYVDGVILSVYSWPTGTIKMQVDDLQVDGMIAPVQSNAVHLSPDEGHVDITSMSVQEQLEHLQANVPRWIQYQGESLDYLKSLGFNAIITNRVTDSALIEQASRTGMGIIASPPDLVPAQNVASNYQHVQAWLLGLELDRSSLDATRMRVAKLKRFPQTLARPTIGEAMEMAGAYSRMSDWLAIPQPLPTRVTSSREASAIMQSDMMPLSGRSLPLTSIVTQMPYEWIVQKELANRSLGAAPGSTPDHDLLQVRLQVYRSMMQGSRGWIFRSGTPLDSGDLTSTVRSQGYTAINREIELFMPWIRSGQSNWQPLTIDSPNHTGMILETPNSQLAIVVASGPMDQICSVAPTNERIQITLPPSGQMRNVFRVTNGELQTIRPQQTPSGFVVVIERPALIEQIVTVSDPKPVAYLRDQLATMGPSLVESRIEIYQQVLDIAQRTLNTLPAPANDPRWEELRIAEEKNRFAIRYLSMSNIPAALREADQALLLAQAVVRKAWEDASQQFSSFQSSPLVASPLSLPLHFEFNRLLAGRQWQTLKVPGAPFTTNDAFYESNWQVERRLVDSVQSDCFVGGQGHKGAPCLILSAIPLNDQKIASGYAGAAMRVTSPPLNAPNGAMINIKGVVRIESRPSETQSGLLICDDLGGETLGQLISSTQNSDYAWQRFSLVRFVTRPAGTPTEGIRIHFETRGEMRATISEIEAEIIIPTPPASIPTREFDIDELANTQPNPSATTDRTSNSNNSNFGNSRPISAPASARPPRN